ncbi:hypothetical protein AVEN_127950-1 [Araneus ventricosus]|uniref:Uncharacterized protein n=1 Tax=Araneus ventricosus TaxID=182803 RepID=A0A4Y1ZZU7_ARAVE|nr:hypothetical protein AVEN_127950-1 [Araneus ventricosus]
MMSISDYMVESTAYPLHLDHHITDPLLDPPIHLSNHTENPQAQHHTENDVMEMSTLRHRNTQRFHFPYGTTDYLQQKRWSSSLCSLSASGKICVHEKEKYIVICDIDVFSEKVKVYFEMRCHSECGSLVAHFC